jgi:hypothetical protein
LINILRNVLGLIGLGDLNILYVFLAAAFILSSAVALALVRDCAPCSVAIPSSVSF